jgi:hypothetical protein
MRRKKRRLTKLSGLNAMVHTAVRVPRSDHDRLVEAAVKLGLSVSQVVRAAIRDKNVRVLDGDSAQRL